MSPDSIQLRIASALGVPPDDVEVVPPGPGDGGKGAPGLVRVGGRRWHPSPGAFEQDEELINRVVVACGPSARPAG
jgi:hypothetical protein